VQDPLVFFAKQGNTDSNQKSNAVQPQCRRGSDRIYMSRGSTEMCRKPDSDGMNLHFGFAKSRPVAGTAHKLSGM